MLRTSIPLAALLALASACSGSDTGTIEPARDGGETQAAADAGFVDAGVVERDAGTERDGGPAGSAFSTDIAPILRSYCQTCHSSATRPPRIDLRQDPRATYDRLVDQPARGATLDYIEPGAPEDSYLLLKIQDLHRGVGEGDFMPPPRQRVRVSAAEVETLRAWVADGAPF